MKRWIALLCLLFILAPVVAQTKPPFPGKRCIRLRTKTVNLDVKLEEIRCLPLCSAQLKNDDAFLLKNLRVMVSCGGWRGATVPVKLPVKVKITYTDSFTLRRVTKVFNRTLEVGRNYCSLRDFHIVPGLLMFKRSAGLTVEIVFNRAVKTFISRNGVCVRTTFIDPNPDNNSKTVQTCSEPIY